MSQDNVALVANASEHFLASGQLLENPSSRCTTEAAA